MEALYSTNAPCANGDVVTGRYKNKRHAFYARYADVKEVFDISDEGNSIKRTHHIVLKKRGRGGICTKLVTEFDHEHDRQVKQKTFRDREAKTEWLFNAIRREVTDSN